MNPVALQTTFGMMQFLKHLYSLPFQTPYSLPRGLHLLLWKITGLPLVLTHVHQMCTDILASLESQMALDACVHGYILRLCIGLDIVVQVILLVLFLLLRRVQMTCRSCLICVSPVWDLSYPWRLQKTQHVCFGN